MAREVTIKTQLTIAKGNAKSELTNTIITNLTGSLFGNLQTVTSASAWTQVITGSVRKAKWMAISNELPETVPSCLLVAKSGVSDIFAYIHPQESMVLPVSSSLYYVNCNTTASVSMSVVLCER